MKSCPGKLRCPRRQYHLCRSFYDDEIDNPKLVDYGIMGVEMETAALYILATKYKRQALGLFTVSDHLMTNEHCTAEERQTSFDDMIKLRWKR